MPTLLILWDESYLWGFLAVRAAQTMGVKHTVCRAEHLGDSLFVEPPTVLLVPGGNARLKSLALGRAGRAAIHEYVLRGGHYLGFCGGAGLALNWPGGLALSSCTRAGYDDRLQHFMSGHLFVAVPEGLSPEVQDLCLADTEDVPLLPVWWPGRFSVDAKADVTVLARYIAPTDDFWLADLPIAGLPPDTFSVWKDVYGLPLSPEFLSGQPCVVHGHLGKGTFTLSYSHLETPASPYANAWFAHLLDKLGGIQCRQSVNTAWNLDVQCSNWDDVIFSRLEQIVDQLVCLGLEHHLLFQRTAWLLGWRAGLPGAGLNNLRLALKSIGSVAPGEKTWNMWRGIRSELQLLGELFGEACTQYLLAERLATTVMHSSPEIVPETLLKKERENLFGPPMQAGGLYGRLIRELDRLAYMQAKEQAALHWVGCTGLKRK